jgi:hypothetical protein
MKHLLTSAVTPRAEVRFLLLQLGRATRADIRKALPHLTVDQIDGSLSHPRIGASGPVAAGEVKLAIEDGRTITAKLYEWRETPEYRNRIDSPREAGRSRKRKTKQVTPSGYPDGYFTEQIRSSSWAGLLSFCPGFQAAAQVSTMQTIARRESDSATGKGWGTGVSVMPNTPGWKRPGFMGAMPGARA